MVNAQFCKKVAISRRRERLLGDEILRVRRKVGFSTTVARIVASTSILCDGHVVW